MQNQIQNVSFSDQIVLNSPNKIAWGPNNFLAIASENIVTIYQLNNKKLEVFHKITKHKAKITSLSWNIPTVEFYKPNSFDILLAVGDDDGNCLVYDIFTLSRRGGISPDNCSPSFSIYDTKWKVDDPSTLFILTAQQLLISISIGTAELLTRSKMKLLSINSLNYHSINILLLWTQNIESNYSRISIDLYDSNRILVSSPQNHSYFAMKINPKNKSNRPSQNALSDILKFPIDDDEKLLNIEYFPFRPNCLLLLTNKQLYLLNLFTKAKSSIISYNNIKPFCICSGIFSHSISDRFWLATIDGSIYRSTITEPNEQNEGDKWSIDCMISSPKSQTLLGIFADYLNPSRICAVYTDGIAIIKELPNINYSLSSSKKEKHYSSINLNQNTNQINSQGSNFIERENLYQLLLNQDQKTSQPQFSNENNFDNINHKNKLFITSFIPCLTEQLISWSTDKGRIAFLSASGFITIFIPKEEGDNVFNHLNIDDICYRFKINDKQTTQISFYKDDSIILNGQKIYILNYKQRGKINEISKKVTKFCIKDDILAFTPTLSSFELYTINNSSFTKDFASNIKMFCPCYNDKTKWALLLSSPQNTLFVIGYVISKRYEIDENVYGSIVSIAFAYENIYLATSKSIIHQFNLSTGENKTIVFSSVSMRSISIYKKFIIACDMSNNCSVLNAQDLSFVSSSSCFGKEIQVLNDEYCIAQIKSSQKPVLMLHKFPSLEPVRIIVNNRNIITDNFTYLFNSKPNPNSNKIECNSNNINQTKTSSKDANQTNSNTINSSDLNSNSNDPNLTNSNKSSVNSSLNDSQLNSNDLDFSEVHTVNLKSIDFKLSSENLNVCSFNSNPLKEIFWRCNELDDFELFARQIGDLSFLQFIQVFKHEKDTVLPNVYSTTRKKTLENERCVGACSIQNSTFIDEYIEYLILSEQFERAARFVLTNVNKQNILLANACLSPNAEAVKKIMTIIPSIKGSEKIFALLLKISGDSEEAANVAFKISDTLSSIKFLKMICDDNEFKKFIKFFKLYKENYLSMVFADDYQSAFTILLNSNEISKAYAYMSFIEHRINKENGNDNKDDLFFDNLKIQIKEEWKRLMQK